MSLTVSNKDARRLFLHLQGLSRPPRQKLTPAALLDLIEQLGFVQVDSISTVERAHHMILFSRNQTYRREHLTRLIERDAELFEHWTHDASIIPSRFYPYWKPRFEKARQRLLDRWQERRGPDFDAALETIRSHIRDNGPAMARHFADGNGKKGSSGWWEWHPAKTALEYLWRTGELVVAKREGFQKVYDFADRVLQDCHRAPEVSYDEFVDWKCSAALDRLGIATPGELAAFWESVSPAEASDWCERQKSDNLVTVTVETADGSKPRKSYARPEVADRIADSPEPPNRVRVLSPFDPVLRDRKRAQRLFDFDYRIEIFVPEAKRKYGYYVFPIMQRDRFIGRIDMKHWRDKDALVVKGLWMEPRCKLTKGRRCDLDAELDRLRKFVGADKVAFEDHYIKSPA